MKQKTKGYLAFAFLGGILLTSTVLFALPPPPAIMTDEEVAMEEQGITITNTPMEIFLMINVLLFVELVIQNLPLMS